MTKTDPRPLSWGWSAYQALSRHSEEELTRRLHQLQEKGWGRGMLKEESRAEKEDVRKQRVSIQRRSGPAVLSRSDHKEQ